MVVFTLHCNLQSTDTLTLFLFTGGSLFCDATIFCLSKSMNRMHHKAKPLPALK